MIRAGLIEEHEATGPQGQSFKVLTATERGRVVRVRIDAELKATVATATERARAEGGDRAADEAKRTAAHDLGLHVLNNDQVLYPDAQLDIEDAEGRSGRVNVEIVSTTRRPSRRRPQPAMPCTAAADPRPGRSPARSRAKATGAARAGPHSPAAMDRWSCRCNPSRSPSG